MVICSAIIFALLAIVVSGFMLFSSSFNSRSNIPAPRRMPRVLPVLPPAAMVSTTNNTMVLGIDGTLWAKGDNIGGGLGDNSEIPRRFFDQVGMDTDWAYVTAGNNHTITIKADGTLWAWGHFSYPLLRAGLEYPPLDAEDFYDYFHIPDGLTVIPIKIKDNIMLP